MKTKIVERYSDNGQFSHNVLIDVETGKELEFDCVTCKNVKRSLPCYFCQPGVNKPTMWRI